MKSKKSRVAYFILIVILCSGCIATSFDNDNQRSGEMKMHTAKGEFTITMTPVDGSNTLKLEKQYQGDLMAEGFGEMLATRSKVEGSASYVAIEAVTGTLKGKKGAFTLVHLGVMQGEKRELQVNISPDSGTDELEGISGSLDIIIQDGKHSYVLEYLLPK